MQIPEFDGYDIAAVTLIKFIFIQLLCLGGFVYFFSFYYFHYDRCIACILNVSYTFYTSEVSGIEA